MTFCLSLAVLWFFENARISFIFCEISRIQPAIMGLVKLEIVLDHHPRPSYMPGEQVSGKVIIIFDSPYKAQALKLKFGGKEYVHWTETHTYYDRTGQNRQPRHEHVYYEGNETLFKNEILLAGNEVDNFTFPPGRFEYPFRFQLPIQLPATFSSTYGNISYEVEAVVKRSWYKANEIASKAITVCGIYDLNLQEDAGLPEEVIESKTVGCLCCESGPIVAILRTSRKGYVPGDLIPVEVYVQNNSTRDIMQIKLSLVQVIEHSGSSHYHGSGSKTVGDHVATRAWKFELQLLSISEFIHIFGTIGIQIQII